MHRLLTGGVTEPLDELIRREGGQVLATLIRLTDDFDLAEDAVQEAVVAALETWPRTGPPDNPAAWLTTAARRKAIDLLRREARRTEKEEAAVALLASDETPPSPESSLVRDDMLRLIFTCCHPALAPDVRIALTLRTVCGLSMAQVASIFLTSEAAMAQRLTRAKRKISAAKIPYRIPEDHELTDRLGAVLMVIYGIFTAGHHANEGDHVLLVDTAREAVRLARLVHELTVDEPESDGLLALLLATNARAEARVDDRGDLVLLADQDRSKWDHVAIREAADLVDRALRRRRPGPFQIKAAIACLHGLAPTWDEIDWPQIAELYALLERYEPTAVVRTNRVVAVAEVDGPAAGLALLDASPALPTWHLYWSTRADFLRRLDRHGEAADAYREALRLATNDADRRFLERRLDQLLESP